MASKKWEVTGFLEKVPHPLSGITTLGLWEDTGEGGLTVIMAMWPAGGQACHGGRVEVHDQVVGSWPFEVKSRIKELEKQDLPMLFQAAMTVGRTNWCGYQDGKYWSAHWSDLTDEGLELREIFEKLYPGAEIVLLTCLDT